MKRWITTLLAAMAVLATMALPASAAPANKGTTFIAPSDITASVLVDVISPVTPDGDFVGFGVVGNPTDGTIEHVGGLVVYSPALDKNLKLKNFTIDLDSGYITALVPGIGRAPLFMLDGLTLRFTETASQVLLGNSDITGAVAGTAMPDWPFI
jgi:hypothetical protein